MPTHRPYGFSILELIIALVIIGILTIFITVAWPGSSINLHAQAAAVANDIRYAQSLSMAKGQRFYFIKTSSTSYQIRGADNQPIALPSGNTTATLDQGTSFGNFSNLPNNLVAFDCKGVPYVDTGFPGTSLSAVTSPSSPVANIPLATNEYSINLTINPETGKVSP